MFAFQVNVNELYVQEEYAQFEDPFGATDGNALNSFICCTSRV